VEHPPHHSRYRHHSTGITVHASQYIQCTLIVYAYYIVLHSMYSEHCRPMQGAIVLNKVMEMEMEMLQASTGKDSRHLTVAGGTQHIYLALTVLGLSACSLVRFFAHPFAPSPLLTTQYVVTSRSTPLEVTQHMASRGWTAAPANHVSCSSSLCRATVTTTSAAMFGMCRSNQLDMRETFIHRRRRGIHQPRPTHTSISCLGLPLPCGGLSLHHPPASSGHGSHHS
jgi:hypothetical protein